MTVNTERPQRIITVEGDEIDGEGARCASCFEPMADHACPLDESAFPRLQLLSSTAFEEGENREE